MNLAYKKILGKFTKVLGFGKTPPPHVGKNSQIISFFLFDSVPNYCDHLKLDVMVLELEVEGKLKPP